MTTAEHDVTRDLAALQQLPADDPQPVDDDPGCATTGVHQTPDPLAGADSGPDPEVKPDVAGPPGAETAG